MSDEVWLDGGPEWIADCSFTDIPLISKKKKFYSFYGGFVLGRKYYRS